MIITSQLCEKEKNWWKHLKIWKRTLQIESVKTMLQVFFFYAYVIHGVSFMVELIKWLKCYNILIFSTFQDLYVDTRRLIVSQRWFEVVTIFHNSIWFSIFVEVHGLDNFFVNINVGIKIGKTKLCFININMSSKQHCHFSKYKT